jgi:hypothetical protein
VSKRPDSQKTHFDADPSASNVRDPQQQGDELQRKPTPRREDSTQAKTPKGGRADGK